MLKLLYVIFIFFGFSLTSQAQVLLQEDQALMEEFKWIFKTDVKHACNTSKGSSEIVETDVKTCQFVNTFNMYPNPASKVLNVEFEASSRSTSLFISSIDGKLIYSEKISDFTGGYKNQIDLSDFPKGIHVLTIVQNDESFIKKLVVK